MERFSSAASATLIREEIHKEKQEDVINLPVVYRIYLERLSQWCTVSGCSQLAVTDSTGYWCGTGMARSGSQTSG